MVFGTWKARTTDVVSPTVHRAKILTNLVPGAYRSVEKGHCKSKKPANDGATCKSDPKFYIADLNCDPNVSRLYPTYLKTPNPSKYGGILEIIGGTFSQSICFASTDRRHIPQIVTNDRCRRDPAILEKNNRQDIYDVDSYLKGWAVDLNSHINGGFGST